ncbi:hypothetical protein CC80DRAFT_255401 [Byssothecium circinans]|uniref:Uncharacterized protein n=1 Tax=Byssothecium circinans TaxID=147558 RepID=A0A6A5TFM4_9PLEO|nr:hypothetical protein CC80DRAFT_255401 [Byssothecium circinans]
MSVGLPAFVSSTICSGSACVLTSDVEFPTDRLTARWASLPQNQLLQVRNQLFHNREPQPRNKKFSDHQVIPGLGTGRLQKARNPSPVTFRFHPGYRSEELEVLA